jgi:hypothetical protein
VRIDEPGRGDAACCVDLDTGARAAQVADPRDFPLTHADVARKTRRAHAIDDGGVADDEIEMLFARHGGSGACEPRKHTEGHGIFKWFHAGFRRVGPGEYELLTISQDRLLPCFSELSVCFRVVPWLK